MNNQTILEYHNFFTYFFDEFRHANYKQAINHFKHIEYNTVLKLQGFSYKKLIQMLQQILRQDDEFLSKLFEYCIDKSKKQEFQYHGILNSLDSGELINKFLENKQYRNLLKEILKDLNTST